MHCISCAFPEHVFGKRCHHVSSLYTNSHIKISCCSNYCCCCCCWKETRKQTHHHLTVTLIFSTSCCRRSHSLSYRVQIRSKTASFRLGQTPPLLAGEAHLGGRRRHRLASPAGRQKLPSAASVHRHALMNSSSHTVCWLRPAGATHRTKSQISMLPSAAVPFIIN